MVRIEPVGQIGEVRRRPSRRSRELLQRQLAEGLLDRLTEATKEALFHIGYGWRRAKPGKILCWLARLV